MPVDFENDLLLITAASGKQGTALLPLLAPKYKRLRLQCISSTSRQRLQNLYPRAEVLQTDFSNAQKLLENVTACYLITPAFHPRESQLGINMVDAAAESYRKGILKHFVFSSVLHSSIRAMANHDSKRYVEEALIESEVPYTVLQPTHVMDNVPIKMLAKQERPVFKARFDPKTKFSFVCTHDLAEAAARIFAEREKHFYASYEIVGTAKPMDYVQAMGIVGEVIGKEVKIERMGIEEAIEGFKGVMPEGMAELEEKVLLRNASRLFVYYNCQGLVGNSNVLEMVLGRKGLGYREWVEMELKGQ